MLEKHRFDDEAGGHFEASRFGGDETRPKGRENTKRIQDLKLKIKIQDLRIPGSRIQDAESTILGSRIPVSATWRQSSPELPRAAQSSPELPQSSSELPQSSPELCQSFPELPRAAPELPGAPQSCSRAPQSSHITKVD